MKKKCDFCDKRATTHLVEIVGGKKIVKYLCDEHASQQGLIVKTAHTPINELLTNFVKMHGGPTVQQEAACAHCGLTFSEFRDSSLLGCPNCYRGFDDMLEGLISRAHESATQHIGKVPRRAGAAEQKQVQVLRMRKQLDDAVLTEDYERAARLRDDLNQLEKGL